MRKLTILVMLLWGALNVGNAQVGIGLRGGVNFASQSIKGNILDSFSVENVTGISAGLFVELPVSEFFSIQPEFQFIQRGKKAISTLQEGGLTFKRTTIEQFSYLEIPILAKVKFGNDLIKGNFFAGPNFGYALSGTEQETTFINGGEIVEENEFDFENSHYKRLDVGALAGLGVSVHFEGFSVFADYRYLFGLADLDDGDGEVTVKNRGSNLGVGIAFEIGY
ncbi:MAG: PorT family protein [Saprospiraceae bacterium]|nr:PorT family protein [Saprospiraceae bacterium]